MREPQNYLESIQKNGSMRVKVIGAPLLATEYLESCRVKITCCSALQISTTSSIILLLHTVWFSV